jgi:hypothetical protein
VGNGPDIDVIGPDDDRDSDTCSVNGGKFIGSGGKRHVTGENTGEETEFDEDEDGTANGPVHEADDCPIGSRTVVMVSHAGVILGEADVGSALFDMVDVLVDAVNCMIDGQDSRRDGVEELYSLVACLSIVYYSTSTTTTMATTTTTIINV